MWQKCRYSFEKKLYTLRISFIFLCILILLKEQNNRVATNRRINTVVCVFAFTNRLVNSARRCTSRRRRIILLPHVVQIRSTWPRLRWIGFPDYGDPSGHSNQSLPRRGRKRERKRGGRAIRIARKVKLRILADFGHIDTGLFLLHEQ